VSPSEPESELELELDELAEDLVFFLVVGRASFISTSPCDGVAAFAFFTSGTSESESESEEDDDEEELDDGSDLPEVRVWLDRAGEVAFEVAVAGLGLEVESKYWIVDDNVIKCILLDLPESESEEELEEEEDDAMTILA
jgi:hypothetical protein